MEYQNYRTLEYAQQSFPQQVYLNRPIVSYNVMPKLGIGKESREKSPQKSCFFISPRFAKLNHRATIYRSNNLNRYLEGTHTRDNEIYLNTDHEDIKNELMKELRRTARDFDLGAKKGCYLKKRRSNASSGKFDKLLASFEIKSLTNSCPSINKACIPITHVPITSKEFERNMGSPNRIMISIDPTNKSRIEKRINRNESSISRPSSCEINFLPSRGYFIRTNNNAMKYQHDSKDFSDNRFKSRSAIFVNHQDQDPETTSGDEAHHSQRCGLRFGVSRERKKNLTGFQDSDSMDSLKDIIKRGWIYKYDNNSKTCQRIYAILTKNLLKFYRNQDDYVHALLELNLNDCIGLKKVEVHPDHHGFVLLTVSMGALTLGAVTSGIRQGWIDSIGALIRDLETESPNTLNSRSFEAAEVCDNFGEISKNLGNMPDLCMESFQESKRIKELEDELEMTNKTIEELKLKLDEKTSYSQNLKKTLDSRDSEIDNIKKEHEVCTKRLGDFEENIKRIENENNEKLKNLRKNELSLKKSLSESKETIKHFFQLPLCVLFEQNAVLLGEDFQERFKDSTLLQILKTNCNHQDLCGENMRKIEACFRRLYLVLKGERTDLKTYDDINCVHLIEKLSELVNDLELISEKCNMSSKQTLATKLSENIMSSKVKIFLKKPWPSIYNGLLEFFNQLLSTHNEANGIIYNFSGFSGDKKKNITKTTDNLVIEKYPLLFEFAEILNPEMDNISFKETLDKLKDLQTKLLKKISELIHGKSYRELVEEEEYSLNNISEKEDLARFFSEETVRHYGSGKVNQQITSEIYKICIRVLLFFKQENPELKIPNRLQEVDQVLIEQLLPALAKVNIMIDSISSKGIAQRTLSPIKELNLALLDKHEESEEISNDNAISLTCQNSFIEQVEKLCKALMENMCQTCKKKLDDLTEIQESGDHIREIAFYFKSANKIDEHAKENFCVQYCLIAFLREVIIQFIQITNEERGEINGLEHRSTPEILKSVLQEPINECSHDGNKSTIALNTKDDNKDMMHVIAAIHRTHSEEVNKIWTQIYGDWVPKDFFAIYKQEANTQLKVLYDIIEQLLSKSLSEAMNQPTKSLSPQPRVGTQSAEKRAPATEKVTSESTIISRLHHGKPTYPTRRSLVEDYKKLVRTTELIKLSYQQMRITLKVVASLLDEWQEKRVSLEGKQSNNKEICSSSITKAKASITWLLTDLEARISSFESGTFVPTTSKKASQ